MNFEELKNAIFVEHHKCGGCGAPVGYQIHPELAAAVFQSGCDCGNTYPTYRLLTHSELADINTDSSSATK